MSKQMSILYCEFLSSEPLFGIIASEVQYLLLNMIIWMTVMVAARAAVAFTTDDAVTDQ